MAFRLYEDLVRLTWVLLRRFADSNLMRTWMPIQEASAALISPTIMKGEKPPVKAAVQDISNENFNQIVPQMSVTNIPTVLPIIAFKKVNFVFLIRTRS